MEVLIILCLALGVLYFWLIGHWFARVIVTLGLGVVLMVGGVLLLTDPAQPVASAVLSAIGGFAVAFTVASIPTWVHAYRHPPASY